MDCAINCNLALVNVHKSDLRYDAGGLHRAMHPGAGAITPYHNSTTKAKRMIPVGGELFKVRNLQISFNAKSITQLSSIAILRTMETIGGYTAHDCLMDQPLL